MTLHRFYLADPADTVRLCSEGTVEPAHTCITQYFDSADEAYQACHRRPEADSLTVHAVRAAETLPGVGVGQDFATAEDVYQAVADGVVARVAADVAAIMGAG